MQNHVSGSKNFNVRTLAPMANGTDSLRGQVSWSNVWWWTSSVGGYSYPTVGLKKRGSYVSQLSEHSSFFYVPQDIEIKRDGTYGLKCHPKHWATRSKLSCLRTERSVAQPRIETATFESPAQRSNHWAISPLIFTLIPIDITV